MYNVYYLRIDMNINYKLFFKVHLNLLRNSKYNEKFT